MEDDSEYNPWSSWVSGPPSVEDLIRLCAELNAKGAKCIVVGGFTIRGAAYMR